VSIRAVGKLKQRQGRRDAEKQTSKVVGTLDDRIQLAATFFAFDEWAGDIDERLDETGERDHLLAIVMRLYLADRLRHRLGFRTGIYPDTPWLSWLVDEEASILELYLLCTCVDALAGNQFIQFPEWLAVSSPRARQQYGLDADESKIRSILEAESHDIKHPGVFRRVARQIYSDVYAHRYGNVQAFRGFFHHLPKPMTDILLRARLKLSAWG